MPRTPVVGLDTDSYGFAAVGLGTQWEWTTCVAKGDVDERRNVACKDFRDLLDSLDPGTWVFCEEPLSLKNGKTSRVLALMAGALWGQAIDHDIFWSWVDVASWKRVIVGRGNADKSLIRAHVRQAPSITRYEGAEWRLEAYEAKPDLYDAHCLAQYGRLALAQLPTEDGGKLREEKVSSES